MKSGTRRSLGRATTRPARGPTRTACGAFAALLIATILLAANACAARAATVDGAVRFEDEFTPTRASILNLDEQAQIAAPTTQSDKLAPDAADQRTNEPVNPVPLTPQLGAAVLTLIALAIARYRGPLIKWLAS